MSFPLPKAFAGGGWTQDQGVDINGGTSAIANAPLLAIGAGTIVGHGISGFGNDAPILKLDQPINGQQYVYYGHAGPGGAVPVGTHVADGAAVGQVGAGIVGMSSGPHLEIGFSDVRGTPVAGSSGTMLAFLHSAVSGAPAHAPTTAAGASSSGGGILGSGVGPNIGPNLNPVDAISGFFSGILDKIVKEAKYAGLLLVVIVGGFVLLAKGINRTTHAQAAA